MANTTNFGWETPDDTDLVKDGAAAIRTLGSAIDTSLVDLKGGTTGQVLAKASNTDMDFSWVAQDDSNAIQNAIVDAKGDLISATAADTPERLAVGANGTVLTADSAETTGLKWVAPATGSYTSLATGTLSGSVVNITGLSGSYKHLFIQIFDVTNNTSDTYLTLRVNADSGSNYLTSRTTSATTQTSMFLANNNAVRTAADNYYGVWIYDYAATTNYKLIVGWVLQNSAGVGFEVDNRIGSWNNNSSITQINIQNNAGNTFAGGTYTIWGVK